MKIQEHQSLVSFNGINNGMLHFPKANEQNVHKKVGSSFGK